MKNEEIIPLMRREAKGLLDDKPGTNPEYERGLCELIARCGQALGVGGFTDEMAKTIAKEIGADWP
jgi:hypothetical protein